MLPEETPPRTKLLIIDDHEVIRVGLRAVLAQAGWIDVVGEADNATRGVAEAMRLRPDVVLMDVRLPDGSGIGASREIAQSLPKTAVLFLTSYSDDDSVMAAVLAGAKGYVLKQIDTAALIRAIRTVATGGSILDPVVTERALQWMKDLASPPRMQARTLSPQQERVLELVALGKTNKEIAADMGLSEKTVKNYLANLFEKLGVSRRSQAVAFFLRR